MRVRNDFAWIFGIFSSCSCWVWVNGVGILQAMMQTSHTPQKRFKNCANWHVRLNNVYKTIHGIFQMKPGCCGWFWVCLGSSEVVLGATTCSDNHMPWKLLKDLKMKCWIESQWNCLGSVLKLLQDVVSIDVGRSSQSGAGIPNSCTYFKDLPVKISVES